MGVLLEHRSGLWQVAGGGRGLSWLGVGLVGTMSRTGAFREGAGPASESWQVERRISVPARVSGYLHRPALMERCTLTERRLTVLQAAGGFGKTTLLAECCRSAIARGVLTAWLSIDERDDAATAEILLALALRRAGLTSGRVGARSADQPLAEALRAVAAQGAPCVLALDGGQRVAGALVAVVNGLLTDAPPNLHLAFSGRELPAGLDVATAMARREVEIVTTDDLRFSRGEIGRFFEGKLSRRGLTDVIKKSAGWPIALRCYRDAGAGDARETVARSVLESWIDSRLWGDLSEPDREFLLDVGLLEWLDVELLDEALSGTGLMERLEGLSAVEGLLGRVRGTGGQGWQLNPLIRQYCVKRRRSETPLRYRSVHRRLALALARRHDAVAAMRHAVEAEDHQLAGEILATLGGAALLLVREGSSRLVSAARLLTDDSITLHPQLATVRALELIAKNELAEARRVFEPLASTLVDMEAGDRDHPELWIVQGLLLQNSCASIGSEDVAALSRAYARLSARADLDPLVRAAFGGGLCQVHELRAQFPTAIKWADRARRLLENQSSHVAMALDFQLGQIAMAQGRVEDARTLYRRGLRLVKEHSPPHPWLTALGQSLLQEIEWERNRAGVGGDVQGSGAAVWRCGGMFASYAATVTVAAEVAFTIRGAERALALIEEMWNSAARAGLQALVRYVAGLRVTVLAEAGRVAEAESRWQDDALPRSTDECLDLDSQSWREMELLSSARLRILTARGEFAEGRRLVGGLLEVAVSHGLRRTCMRALAQAMALEYASGDEQAALGHLTEYLNLFAETDYVRPMMRERDAAIILLSTYLERTTDTRHGHSAEALLASLATGDPTTVPALTNREWEVLTRLAKNSDKQIANALGLSVAGVRYHVQRLFGKLHVSSRIAAVERAQTLGILVWEVD